MRLVDMPCRCHYHYHYRWRTATAIASQTLYRHTGIPAATACSRLAISATK